MSDHGRAAQELPSLAPEQPHRGAGLRNWTGWDWLINQAGWLLDKQFRTPEPPPGPARTGPVSALNLPGGEGTGARI